MASARLLARPFAAASLALPGALAAQGGAAPALPPVRPLGAVTATAPERLGGLAAVRHLPGGRVLVNDAGRRRVLLFDSTLATFTVVADTTAATGNAYSGRIGGLIAYRGDSTLFVDPTSLSMLLIDPQGKLGRVMSVPRPDDAMALTGIAFGAPGFDARGRLVYRSMPRMQFRTSRAAGEGPPQPPAMADTAPIVRVDLATRRVDTVAFVKTFAPRMSVTTDAEGRTTMSSITDPLPVVDDWAVLSDGTIAILRGRDFHVDLVDAEGRTTSLPKVAHDWQRLSDEEKVAFLDSTRTAMQKQRDEMRAQGGAAGPGGMRVSGDGLAGGGAPMVVMMTREGGPPPRGGDRGGDRTEGAPGGPPREFALPPLQFVSPSELPDYKPAFAQGASRADADGRVWVRTIPTKPMAGPVYSVIDRSGALVDRVMIPAGTAIAGFGPGGVVYLGRREGGTVQLLRAQTR